MTGYSHIVIGAGAIGSATAYRLAAQGARKVLVVEQFDLINTLNSSGDHSRIIRRAYHDDAYVNLTSAMFSAWEEIEHLSGLTIYTRTGGLDMAPAEGRGAAELEAFKQPLRNAGVPFDELSAEDIRAEYPQWTISDDTVGFFQQDAGIVDIRRSVSAHTSLALSAGVEFLARTRVEGITVRDDSVTVRTAQGDFDADHLLVAAGSWTEELQPDLLDFPLVLSQEQVSYIAAPHLRDFLADRFPVWSYHGSELYYGFPVYGEAAIKLARDMRGHFIESKDRVFEGDEKEADVLRAFLSQHLPRAVGPTLVNRTCVYDMAPDREFILDTLPGRPHVAVFNGAGHAGKFAALIGKILADLLTDGTTKHDIGAFSLQRPALTDPGFQSVFRHGAS
ncbi:N-methyl-L-tryptophan oxidase [Streptomyces dysideae]|uniref:FAD dependent oxidoreductase domain-containing protein n=1 Tax=Streptomyces dysideae TaxID=909626 RepID=A0A101UWB4_9ACTN|nr:N-methyl-L-tryptophan oxidase [Streptomyces dysideae]KUO18069.1 hypothetical protein AQJ91_27115 [Streptomyces dysideae]